MQISPKKILRKSAKILGWLLLAVLVLFFVLALALRSPRVQTWAVEKVTQTLSETLNAEVEVGRVDIDFFKTVVLEDIFIADQKRDTLLDARELKVNIGLLDILGGEIYLNQAELNGANIKLYRHESDSVFNYQFLIDAFASEPNPADSTAAGFTFGLGSVVLKGVHFSMLDEGEGRFDLEAFLGKWEVTADKFDLDNQRIALDEVQLFNSDVAFRLLKKDSSFVAETPADTSTLTFPGFGWDVSASQIRLSESRLAFSDDKVPRNENALDFNHLHLRELNLPIDDFRYSDEMILAKIEGASFSDHSGFQLDELSAEAEVFDTSVQVADLVLRTPQSDFRNDTKMSFGQFADLTDFLHKVKLTSEFGESRLAVSDLLLLAPAVAEIPNLKFPEGERMTMRGGLFLENEKLTLDNLRFAIGEGTKLSASGSIAELMGEQRFDLKITELSTSHASLEKFTEGVELPEGLKNFGTFRLAGNVIGTLGQLSASDLKLTTESATRFLGNLKITGLPDIENAFFRLKIKELATRSEDLAGFSERPLPPQLDSLGLVQFSGKYKGTTTDFSIVGNFKTAAGGARTDLKIKFTEDYSDATYRGSLALQKFDLGKVLADTSQFGKVTLDTRLQGRGLTLDSLNTRMDGTVESLRFNGYDYENIVVDGRFDQRQFSGQLGMEDPNLDFDFSGLANLNDSIPIFVFNLDIDTVNLAALNFYPDQLGISGAVDARLRGGNLDDLDGQATVKNLSIESAEEKYFDRKISLSAEQLKAGKRRLQFDANFLQAKVEGQYRFADLPDLVIGYVTDFFPVEKLALPADSPLSPRPKIAEQNFDFEMHFIGLSDLVNVFVPGLISLDTSAYIRGNFDSESQNLNMLGAFPEINFDGIKIDSVRLSANGNARRLKTNLAVRQLDFNGGFFASQINLNTRLGDDTLRFDFEVLDDTLGQDFRLAGSATEAPDDYHLRMERVLVLNKEDWDVDQNNLIKFTRNDLKINDLIFRKNNQSIHIASVGEASSGDIAPLDLKFNNFRLREVSALLNNPNLDLAGGLNGGLRLKEPLTNLHYNAALTVDSLTLNKKLFGQLNVEASQPRNSKTIQVDVALGGRSEATIEGEYDVAKARFDLEAELGRFPLTIVDPFMVGLLENSEGYLSGNFTLRGTPDEPALNGKISTSDVSTRVVLAGLRFALDKSTISISEKAIDLGQMKLTDPERREALLSGKIRHEYFDDLRFDLRAQTEGLRVLNTSSNDNQLYWGDILAAADIRIGGTVEEPRLDITATTLDRTNLHVQPLYQDLAVVREDYIIFAKPTEYEGDSLQVLEQKIKAGATGIDLTLRLQVTPAAELNVIIDPATGDQLFCRGNADLIVKMDPAGNIDITGSYVIENGQYSFAYEGLVKRNFQIRKGSSLTFTGDPLAARFDITAVYQTRATTYELIANESSFDESTLASSRRRTDVNVLLNIDGDLAQPEISFDIELPQNQDGAVDNLVVRKLASLREQSTEMNKQVFSLILFNSFLASESGAGLANAGENAALRSVSSLVSSQLNRLAGRYLKGVDLSLGFESYRAAGEGDASTVSELNVGLSKQLFNDRLTIRVGGNFNLENSQSSELQAGNTSSIAGDFVLEYKITEAGDYLLKVFHKSNYNALIDANTNKTGVGLMYRKSY